MTNIRIAEHTDYISLYELLFNHKRIGKESQYEVLSLNEFQNKMKQNTVVFLFEENGILNSYMITLELKEFPLWVMRLIVTRPIDNFYRPESNGIADLYDYAITYWESQGITAFSYIQPKSYIRSANARLRKASKKLQSYTSFTLYQYDKNKPIEHLLSRKISGRDMFTNDVVIRMHYKDEIP